MANVAMYTCEVKQRGDMRFCPEFVRSEVKDSPPAVQKLE